MTPLRFPNSSCATFVRSRPRRFKISAAGRRGLLPALLLALVLGLFTLPPKSAASDFQVFKYFTNAEGAHPFSELVEGSDGMLYGTTVTGNNSAEHDTIFKVNPDGSDFTVLLNFDSATTGGNCWGGLLLGADGVLYGITFTGGGKGGGTVFKLNQDGSDFAVLKHLDTVTNGGGSYARLMEIGDVLYGTTYVGGDDGVGTIFKLNQDGSNFSVIHHFNSPTGSHPTAALTQGPDGMLYGTALHGGSFLYGTIFKLNTDGTGYTVLRHLDAATTGAYSQARLLLGTDGALYGTASEGGAFTGGTVFKLNRDGTGFTILKSLGSSGESAMPYAGLLEGADGKLYGSTLRGGTYDWGTVFELNADGTDYRVLRRFDYALSGGSLFAGVIQGRDGALYGAAAYGWDEDFGTLFRLMPTPNTAPTAVAGDDQSIHAGIEVNLNGSASFDEDTASIALVYAWSFSSRPSGSTATLTNPGTATPAFTPDLTGAYVVQLIVTDEDGLSSTADFVEISSSNQAPTAVASANFTQVLVGEQVQFDGSASTDPDGDLVIYAWTLGEVPPGSVAVLTDADTEYPTLTPDLPGDYEVILTVSDPLETGTSATVTISAASP